MTSNIVKNWFEKDFEKLAPQLQELHIFGGKLTGDINVTYGRGIAGIIGKRLAKKLGIPNAGNHVLVVTVCSQNLLDRWSLYLRECFAHQVG